MKLVGFSVTITLFISIGIGAITILLLLYYRKKMMREQEEAKNYQKVFFSSVMQIVEFDRERISKNIHDEVGTVLSIIKLNLSKIFRNPDNVQQTKLLLEESMALLESSIDHTRAISMDLTSPTLAKLGYEKGIIELCRQINASDQIKVTVVPGETEVRMLPVIESQVYRVMKEVLNNIIRHANASEINVALSSGINGTTTKVIHNGIGLNGSQVKKLLEEPKGVGLRSIHKQLELIDASIEYDTNEDQSTITINIPRYEKGN